MNGHSIWGLERFRDSTRWMVEFKVLIPGTRYGGSPEDMIRLFMTEEEFLQAVESHRKYEISVKRYAHVTEGNIVPVYGIPITKYEVKRHDY